MVQVIKNNIKENWQNIRLIIEIIALFFIAVIGYMFNENSQKFNDSARKLDTIILEIANTKKDTQSTIYRVEKVEQCNTEQDAKIHDSRERIIRIETKVFKDRNNNLGLGE